MLYIMRHGQTEWNKNNKLQGQTDVPLNDNGREMAKKAAIECSNIHFDVCYCSPLIRAYETASLVLNNRNIPIITDERLKEMCFGIFEGTENYRQIKDCPINVFFEAPEEYVNPVDGGESLEELYKRTGSFIDEVVKPLLKEEKDVLIVGHGAMNSSIVCQIRNLPIDEFWSAGIENCKLMKL